MATSQELGTFFFTIDLNNQIQDKLDQIIKNTTKKTEEGEKKKQSAIKKTSQAIFAFSQQVATSMLAIKAVAIGTGAIFGKVMDSINNYAVGLLQASAVTQASTRDLQALSKQFSILGNISTGQAQEELTALASKIQEAKMGFSDPKQLTIAGINFNQGTTLKTAINDLRTSLKGYSDAQATVFLKQAGLSSNFLFFLRATEEEMKKINEIPFLTEQQLKDIQKAGRSFKFLKELLGGIYKTAQARLAPYLRVEMDKLFAVIVKNKEKFIQFFEDVVKLLVRFTQSVGNVTSMIANFTGSLFNSDKGLQIFLGGLVAIKLAMSPLTRTLTLFYLILDDIAGWSQGKESLFGGLYDVFKQLHDFSPVLGKLAIGLAALGGLKITGALGKLNVALGPLLKFSKVLGPLAAILAINQGISALEEGSQSDSGEDRRKRVALKVLEYGGYGAVGGSFIPGVGTAVGAAVGLVAGGIKGIYDETQQAQRDTSIPIPQTTQQAIQNSVNNANKNVEITDNSTTTITVKSVDEANQIIDNKDANMQKEYKKMSASYGGI